MSDLTLGQPRTWPDGWSIPAPVFNYETGEYEDPPIAWVKRRPAREEDIAAVEATNTCQKRGGVDELTLCGKKDPEYTTWTEEAKEQGWPYAPTYTA